MSRLPGCCNAPTQRSTDSRDPVQFLLLLQLNAGRYCITWRSGQWPFLRLCKQSLSPVMQGFPNSGNDLIGVINRFAVHRRTMPVDRCGPYEDSTVGPLVGVLAGHSRTYRAMYIGISAHRAMLVGIVFGFVLDWRHPLSPQLLASWLSYLAPCER